MRFIKGFAELFSGIKRKSLFRSYGRYRPTGYSASSMRRRRSRRSIIGNTGRSSVMGMFLLIGFIVLAFAVYLFWINGTEKLNELYVEKEESVEGFLEPEDIRVVLKSSSFDSHLHKDVILSGEEGLCISGRENEHLLFIDGGTEVLITSSTKGLSVSVGGEEQEVYGDKIIVETVENSTTSNIEGRIVVKSIKRGGLSSEAPSYRGKLEIEHRPQGILVINIVNFEEYLYAVLPAEMPSSYGPEALKAQAVASRSFAYKAVTTERFSNYSAHVDDSMSSQVYNNWGETDEAIQAVDDTKGLILYYEGEPVEALFFSASSGYTANSYEVWPQTSTGVFPGQKTDYLMACAQGVNKQYDLTCEKGFSSFLERDEGKAFDADSPYFRWHIEMSRKEVEASIEHNLNSSFQGHPQCVLTLEGNNYVSKKIPDDPLGTLLDLRVIKRGQGGNMMIIEIEGTKGTYRLVKEYVVRHVLRPVQYLTVGKPIILQRSDGSTVEDFSLLPSAFALFDIIKDVEGNIDKVIFRGGGMGHGVGMSQYGAKELSDRGWSYQKILEHYYPGAKLVRLQ